MFNKILIANRGEIACRVAATCKRLGITSVAVYSDADANAKHVAACDEAVHIGGSTAAESYLRVERIIEAAIATGAQAVHPGYGFLSENEDFAHACEKAGIAFIGPPVEAIAAMGSKAAAKALMHSAAVPLVPGYHGDDQNADLLHRQADEIGYPVLLKASAGGGGKGMRVVTRTEEFDAALASCKREAASSFGNDRVLIEKYLTRPRHVEVQVFADKHGGAVYLFDRDCSVQRRHQKVLEEAPAPGLQPHVRRAMGEAAVAAARAVNYVGAGTVEFIMTEGGEFYFMEMNTRLQVEHPVTEMVTGLDLVEWQLRVAAGEPLPLAQDQLRVEGHAIEARIYAEHPARGFLPSTGTLKHLRMPEGVEFSLGAGGERAPVRIDSGVREGDTITPFYDPMIAKLIVHGASREEALKRMSQALRGCEVVGPHTNVEFLQRIVASVPFSTGDLDTGLIERHHDALFAPVKKPFVEALALACGALLTREGGVAHGASPWDALSHWRLNGGYTQTLNWRDVEKEAAFTAVFSRDGDTRTLTHDGRTEPFKWWTGAGQHEYGATIGDAHVTGRVFIDGDTFHVFCRGDALAFEWQNLLAHAADAEHGEGRLTAPMPGKVIAVLVEQGAVVEKGQPLIVMEAMKMEHTIGSPTAGKVAEVLYAVGDQVTDGAQLLVLDVE
ncbi:acetyl/propionyl/methylcrotonyl-CoA carboxylase subunit alpha [Paraburkholderia hospita]|uniref:Acetyl/propionyl/methylcrotonyl-CoA carboxylase subunit alpha n=3 Tax=Paraburkholderia hospita TaxID=169430 RepID=A0AAN1ML45_9BURK|nr:acetyl/propionyl/methylcrotonyl-CoA carboxylase subunit alpha [Paraburkholderia hospita]AUT71093.1 acetyl/propionyl/methylcrotonyl-CoA carboxylase subunit alpha [Paraburkholderia hospita]EIM95475.1 carbamoyl-phosphate synthase L chain ATP-binding protein [Paraburkholderia hospita]OUL68804.1 3-methylcrotonyl-CoA carboxylase [Paraburkholderia hospita]SEI24860.1 3-methylcrotonoyl-CoA carboxylase, alpha subunit [Paraburkholderia hospita]